MIELHKDVTVGAEVKVIEVFAAPETDVVGDAAEPEIDLDDVQLVLQKITRASDRMREQNTTLEARQQALNIKEQQLDEEMRARRHRLEQHEQRVQEQDQQIQQTMTAQTQRSAELHTRGTELESREAELVQKLASIESVIKEVPTFTQRS